MRENPDASRGFRATLFGLWLLTAFLGVGVLWGDQFFDKYKYEELLKKGGFSRYVPNADQVDQKRGSNTGQQEPNILIFSTSAKAAGYLEKLALPLLPSDIKAALQGYQIREKSAIWVNDASPLGQTSGKPGRAILGKFAYGQIQLEAQHLLDERHPTHAKLDLLKETLFHELGHLIDSQVNKKHHNTFASLTGFLGLTTWNNKLCEAPEFSIALDNISRRWLVEPDSTIACNELFAELFIEFVNEKQSNDSLITPPRTRTFTLDDGSFDSKAFNRGKLPLEQTITIFVDKYSKPETPLTKKDVLPTLRSFKIKEIPTEQLGRR